MLHTTIYELTIALTLENSTHVACYIHVCSFIFHKHISDKGRSIVTRLSGKWRCVGKCESAGRQSQAGFFYIAARVYLAARWLHHLVTSSMHKSFAKPLQTHVRKYLSGQLRCPKGSSLFPSRKPKHDVKRGFGNICISVARS